MDTSKTILPESPSFTPAIGVEELFDKLDGFHTLTAERDGLRASPSAAAIEIARAFLRCVRARGVSPSRLAPSIIGGIGVTFRQGERKLYVEFGNAGTAHALFSDGVTEPVVEKVSPDAAGYDALLVKLESYLHEQPAAPDADKQSP